MFFRILFCSEDPVTGIGGMKLVFGAVTLISIACALILGIITNPFVPRSEE